MKAVLICMIVLLSPAVYAQENGVKAGITPDSFLYGLDVALDNINLLLTFDQAEKSRKGLEIARERLFEVRAMAVENKLDAMERAQREHDDVLGTVVSSLARLEKENSTEEIEVEIEIEKELEKHKKKIQEVRGEVEIKLKVRGEITPEQQALIDDILTRLENTSGKVEIEIKKKKEKTKIKIKRDTGKGDEEIKLEIEEIEHGKGLTEIKMEKALDKIEDAKEEIAEVKAMLDVNAGVPTLLINAEKHLENAEKAYSDGDFGKAYGQANAAKKNARALKKQLERVEEKEEELEIEAEIEGNLTEVKVEYGDEELEFTLHTTNRAEIVSEIAERTDLSKEEIEAVIKFEEEEDHEQSFKVGNKTAKEKEKKREKEREKEEGERHEEEEREGEERD